MPNGFSGIGAFAEGALRGSDAALSRYASIEDARRRLEADRRAAQSQSLQSLIQGTQLASQYPDVAEQAALEPERYGLSPETVGPGVARARILQGAAAKFARAVQTGDFDEADPDIAQFVASDPIKYAPLLNEAMSKRRLKMILSDPTLTPQQRVQAMISQGVIKPEMSGLQAAYPGLVGAEAEARAGGTQRAELPFVGPRAAAVERGKSDVELEEVPGQTGVTRGGAAARGAAFGRGRGEAEAALVTPPPGTTPETSTERARALARETPAERERRLRGGLTGQIGPKDISAALSRNRTQARAEVQNELRNAKVDITGFPPKQQQEIINYYTQARLAEMAKGDPVLEGQNIPVPPRTPAIEEFERSGTGEGLFSRLGSFVRSFLPGGGTPAPAAPAPPAPAPAPTRSLRSPGPATQSAIPAPPGAKEGDSVRQKSTGKMFRVEHGYLVPLEP